MPLAQEWPGVFGKLEALEKLVAIERSNGEGSKPGSLTMTLEAAVKPWLEKHKFEVVTHGWQTAYQAGVGVLLQRQQVGAQEGQACHVQHCPCIAVSAPQVHVQL
jgi:hypothetical protein